METLTTLAQLDAKLAECDAASKVSDDRLRQVFASFRMDISRDVPNDPFSEEYRDYTLRLYEHIAGRHYVVTNEATGFDVDSAERCPFPYYTQSAATAGFFTMGMGFLLHTLDLHPGARILEFGAGWGNSTIAMAMLGFDVTAVDVEPNFCTLLERRAQRQDVKLTVVNSDFMWAEGIAERFDAIVFFESFHHCADHRRLIAAFDGALNPGGRVYLAAEPIVPDFPIPWGLRMDGESLWAIRKNGWMELGFNETYFQEAMRRAGWTIKKHVYRDLGWAAVREARRLTELANPTSLLASSIAEEPSTVSTEPTARNHDVREVARLQAELESLYRSRSWRLTSPLRRLNRALQGWRR